MGWTGLEPLHHRMRGGGAHGWKHRRFDRHPLGVAGGTLLGPEGTAARLVFFGSGFRPETHTADVGRVGWVSVGVWGSVGCL